MKEQYINRVKALTIRFMGGEDIGADRQQVARELEAVEDVMAEQFGMSWDEIEAVELSALY